MNPIEQGYFIQIKEISDEFISTHKDNKDIASALYATYLVEKMFLEKPLENSCYEDKTIFQASLSLKLYRIVRDVETKIIEIFGDGSLAEKLLGEIFTIVDFD